MEHPHSLHVKTFEVNSLLVVFPYDQAIKTCLKLKMYRVFSDLL